MKKFMLHIMVYGITLTGISGLIAPGIAEAEKTCVNNKLVADLNINALKVEDESLETIRQMYRHLANGVVGPVEVLLSDDVTWKVEGVSETVPFARTYEGKEGVLRYMEDMKDSVCIESLFARFFVKQGNTIHVHLVEEGVADSTGKRFAMEIAHVWILNEDGRIASFREYNDTFAMRAAFDPEADPSLSLVANTADYGIPTSSYTDTLQAVLALYAAFGKGDIIYFQKNSEPDLVFIMAGPTSITPIAGTFYGIDGIADFITRVFTTEVFIDFQIKSITVDGSRMDAECHEVVYVIATGKIFTCDIFHTIIIGDDGKLRSFRSYNDTYSVANGHLPKQ